MSPRLLLAILALTHPLTAHADRQARCIDDFERAQRSRKSGKLLRAREQFQLCADASCPAMVRKDCTDGLAELGKAIPTVRAELRDERGDPIEDFTLEIDGARVPVGAEPVELDPGHHVLVLSSGDHRVEKRVTLRAGDLAVPVVASLAKPERTTAGSAGTPAAGPPTLAWVAGGVALAGVAGFVGFGLAGKSAEGCKGSCSDDEIETIHQRYLLADVSLGVAVVSGAVAGWLFFANDRGAEGAGARRFVGVAPSRTGALVGGGTEF